MLTGTGKLYWIFDSSNPEFAVGFIRGDEINPATRKGYSIDVNDEDPKVKKPGINLKQSHSGTPVKFVARKVANHESYYAVEIEKIQL